MATSSSFSTNPYLVNITDYVTEKLDMTNYLTWSYLFKPVLDIYDLSDHVKPSPTIPTNTIVAADGKSSSDNPDYLAWRKIDILILSWINATIKKEVIPLIYHSTTSSEAWQALESHFLDKSTARELHLKFSLDKLVKGTSSIDTYFQKFKKISDALAAIQQPLTEREKVTRILHGLPSTYESIITIAANQNPPPTFSMLWTMLLSHEARLENLDLNSSQTTSLMPTALVTT